MGRYVETVGQPRTISNNDVITLIIHGEWRMEWPSCLPVEAIAEQE